MIIITQYNRKIIIFFIALVTRHVCNSYRSKAEQFKDTRVSRVHIYINSTARPRTEAEQFKDTRELRVHIYSNSTVRPRLEQPSSWAWPEVNWCSTLPSFFWGFLQLSLYYYRCPTHWRVGNCGVQRPLVCRVSEEVAEKAASVTNLVRSPRTWPWEHARDPGKPCNLPTLRMAHDRGNLHMILPKGKRVTHHLTRARLWKT
jgi:hypothetical protein